MDMRRYLVGNPVYRSASNAPTRGTVDPMGYINRSMGMSPIGGDGLSDKRSGLAQAALNRLRMGASHRSTPPGLHNKEFQTNPVIGMPRNPIDFGPDPGMGGFTSHPAMGAGGLQPQQPQFGHTVSATGQLMPLSPTPEQTTLNSMYGQPQEGGPSETQMMQAARDRLAHHIQTKEMLTKHQLEMQKYALNHAQHINQHVDRNRSRVNA